MMSLRGIVKAYGERVVVDNVSLSFAPSSTSAIAGVNGSGKSTLFRIVAGLVRADAGSVEISEEGETATRLSDLPASKRVQCGLNYIPQEHRVLVGATTLDNLLIALSTVDPKARNARSFCAGLLEELELGYLLSERPRDMSAQDRAFLLLAKAFIQRSRYLIVDEPFAGMDGKQTARCIEILRKMQKMGMAIVLTDHNPLALLELAQTVYIMECGQIVYTGSAQDIRASAEAKRRYFRSV
jgi:lipopolysaccharide export system ATP-binding protein